MRITLFVVGKTQDKYVKEGFEKFEKRIKKYITFDFVVIQDIKNAKNISTQILKEKEGELILQQTSEYDCLVLLDENGKEFGSVNFADYLKNKMLHSTKKMAFVIGGAYGFSEQVYKKANDKISLSKMTFSHQIVRLLFAEQLYRAFTIIKGEPYHHE